MLFDKNDFIPENTPERLYAILKIINNNTFTKEELKEIVTPIGLNKNTNGFDKVFNIAKGKLIKENDFDYSINCLVEDKYLESIDTFRRYMAKMAFSEKNLFNEFTSWYISQNDNVFFYKKAEDLSSRLTDGFTKIDKKFIYGWRFWASFLGYGYLHDIFLIPNMAVRIEDVLIENKKVEVNKEINFTKFMDFIITNCPEITNCIQESSLCIALSNGLRTLHDAGKVELINNFDSDDVWQLFRMESHDIIENVTSIVIKEVLYE